jgi:hypothetical protein
MTENESRILSKFLKKTISALKNVIRDYEEGKIKAESIIKIHELRKEVDDERIGPAQALFEKLTGEDPIKLAREFLKDYDECVSEQQDAIVLMNIILNEIRPQITKN